jgi:hypothetical protein
MVKKAALTLVAFLSVAALIGLAVTRAGFDEGAPAAPTARAPSSDSVVLDEQAAEGSGGGTEAQFGPVPAEVGSAVAELPDLPALGQAVVKTADLTIEVSKGTFTDAFDSAALVASRYGGYVEASSMSGARSKSGTLTIRVPSARFDDAMSDLRGLGVVKHEAVAGQVVTQQFVDLEARLVTWQAQEAVLLGLMEEADSIDSTLRIQRELQDVQFRIEQIKGQLRVLEDQTALATIRVSVNEPGVVVLTQTADGRPSLGEAWERAVDGVLGVAYVTIVGLGYLVPLALLGLCVWLVVRRVVRRETAPPAAA